MAYIFIEIFIMISFIMINCMPQSLLVREVVTLIS